MEDIANHLYLTRKYYYEIETKNERPLDGENIQKLAGFLNATEEETARMFDLASLETRKVPFDIQRVFLFEEIGDLARQALRLSKSGVATVDDWRRFAGETERMRARMERGYRR